MNIVVLLCPSSTLAKINKRNPHPGITRPHPAPISNPLSQCFPFSSSCVSQTSLAVILANPETIDEHHLPLDKGRKTTPPFALLHFCPCIQFAEAPTFWSSMFRYLCLPYRAEYFKILHDFLSTQKTQARQLL